MTDVVARLRQLEAAATPGPWRWKEPRHEYSDDRALLPASNTAEHYWDGDVVLASGCYDENSVVVSREDATLIAAARNALPQLLDELELLRVVAKAAPHVLDALVDIHPMDAGEPCHIYEACVMLNTALAALDSQETE